MGNDTPSKDATVPAVTARCVTPHGVLAMLALLIPLLPVIAEAQQMAQLRGTIVYVRGGNVWVARAATGEKVQVTRDGGYWSPSMADDGTIGALQRLRGETHFVTINAAGRRRVFPSGHLNVIHADLSPDGALFLYTFGVPGGARLGVTSADRWTGQAGGSITYPHGRWMTNERVIFSGNGAFPFLVRGPRTGWEDESSPYRVRIPGLREETYDVARNGTRMLVIGARYGFDASGATEVITGWHAIAYRPARPAEQVAVPFDNLEMRACRGDSTAHFGAGTCAIGWIPEAGFQLQSAPRGFARGAIAPDGRAFTFADTRGVLVTEPIGPSARAFVLDPQGSEPEWSVFQR